MKKISIYLLVLTVLPMLSCARKIPSSSAIYSAASTRHYQLARGQIPSSDQQWLTLIDEFQHIIDAYPDGEWADDAQYAIASCWMWLEESSEQTSIHHAIEAFQKLIQDYPNSTRVPESYYWLGQCYNRLEDYNQAATQFQIVISRYGSHAIADEAQLELGRSYERQSHFESALATYDALRQRCQNAGILSQVKKRIASIQTRQQVSFQATETPLKPAKILQAEAVEDIVPERPDDPHTELLPLPEPPEASQSAVDPSLVQQLGLDVRTIVIDPGHGGRDPGAVSRSGQEKRIVLSLAQMLRDLLSEKGYQVLLTRDRDVYIPLKARTQFATKHDADLFVSIHINASSNSVAAGIETYYLALASDESARMTAMRENIGAKYSIKELDALVERILKESKSTESRRLAQFIQEQLTVATQGTDRGVKHAPFVVLIGTKVPAILVEAGFLSNPEEGRKLGTKTYQRQLAEAIAEGIEQYVRSIPLAVTHGRSL